MQSVLPETGRRRAPAIGPGPGVHERQLSGEPRPEHRRRSSVRPRRSSPQRVRYESGQVLFKTEPREFEIQ